MSNIANLLVRETYRPKTLLPRSTVRPMENLRRAVIESRRYVLDASMSEFLAHLATAPFACAPERRPDVLSSLRHSARLPHPKMFIQYDGQAFRRGLLTAKDGPPTDLQGRKLSGDVNDTLPEIGLFLEQIDPEMISIREFVEIEGDVTTFPFFWVYRTDDLQLDPNSNQFTRQGLFGPDPLAGMLAHGIQQCVDASVAVVYEKPVPPKHQLEIKYEGALGQPIDVWPMRRVEGYKTHFMVAETAGIVRYVLAFLATLNDVPAIKTEVRASKGYFARGNYRKYLDTTTLTLQLPRKATMRTLAKRLIALAWRRWHEVEPHWRVNKKPNGWVCDPTYKHLWSERDGSGHSFCSECGAQRVWIVLPHGRGDPTLGVVRRSEVHVTH